jgi:hypothetical protein
MLEEFRKAHTDIEMTARCSWKAGMAGTVRFALCWRIRPRLDLAR